ncbi:hypothetical protein GO730_24805 [Spirosoma sp. HMF3257]|uniref:Ig-like domain-containing protein n=1 Tax=Spirosoma telluris TaxID=2183553 RepID=A0A327NUS4_9BACT|nr:hypothetical protein [Spirosoma telluris]RAI76568.1 hypothetical protein HMF3257_24750 [Spirosoma telluris]
MKGKPGLPTTPPAPTYCQSQTAVALTATSSASAVLNWYGINATGGTATSIATVPTTTQAGVINYYVSQSLNGCEGPRAAIAVTVKSTPLAPSVTSPIIACQTRNADALSAIPSSGGTLTWYGTAASGGIPSGSAPTPSTTNLGSITYYVSQSVNGCESPRAALTVTVNAIPAAPTATSATYCENSQAQPLSATGQNLKWYGTSSSGGTASSTPSTPSTTILGTTLYYVSQTVSGCESARAGIPVLVKDTPVAPTTASIDFCQGTSAPTLSATLVTNASANWYGTFANGGTPSNNPPTLSSSTPGTTLYYVSQTLSGCEGPRASLSVRVKALPVAPGVSPVSFCNNSSAQPLTAAGAGLKWYDASDNVLGAAPTPTTSTTGTQTYKVSQTIEGCEGAKATLTVTINAIPAAPTGNSPNAYCEGNTAQPLLASGQNLKWYGTSQTGGSGSSNATVPAHRPLLLEVLLIM